MENAKYIHTTDVHNTRAAEEIVPILIEWFHPASVVDVGCGLGTWLYIFKSHGVQDIQGIEGNHLDTELLVINKENVLLTDLEKEFRLENKYDLALSLEVAEHLSSYSADIFIESLTKLSDIIIFSAAVPNQGGQNHINEQWIGYWQSRFAKHDYIFTDEIRPLFWTNEKIEWWYKQNMVVAVKKGIPVPFSTTKPPLDLIHPGLFEMKNAIIYDLNAKYKAATLSNDDFKSQIENLQCENNLLKLRLDKTEDELKNIINSITWRLAHKFVIVPITEIRNLFKNRTGK